MAAHRTGSDGGTRRDGSRRQESAGRPFIVEVAALRRQPGSRRRVVVTSPLPGLEVSESHVDAADDVVLDALLESVSGGILVTATARAPWRGTCRRCLEEARGVLEAEICELCLDEPDEEDSYL